MRIRTFVALFLCVTLAACRQVAPLPASALRDLNSLDRFRDAFNADAGRTRLIVIVSPT